MEAYLHVTVDDTANIQKVLSQIRPPRKGVVSANEVQGEKYHIVAHLKTKDESEMRGLIAAIGYLEHVRDKKRVPIVS